MLLAEIANSTDVISSTLPLIAQYGFPIVACVFMWKHLNTSEKNFSETVARITEQHAEEEKTLAEALNNNTLAIQKLSEKLGGVNNVFD